MGRGRVVAAPRQHWGSPGCCFQPGIPGDAHLRGGQGRCRVPVTSQPVSLGLLVPPLALHRVLARVAPARPPAARQGLGKAWSWVWEGAPSPRPSLNPTSPFPAPFL